jgi:hypothetical protein
MPNTVVSLPAADDSLARIWAAASDPQAVADASNTIDRALKFRADRIGIPRGDRMVFTVPPLAVEFTYSPDDCLVTIHDYEQVG